MLLLRESTLVTLRGSRRPMWRRRCNVHKEGSGIGGGTLCKIRSLPGEDVGEEVFGLIPVGDLLSVFVDSVVVELLVVQFAVPFVPARWDVGRVVRRVPVQVLAEEGGLVAGFLQANGDEVLLVPLGDELLKAPIRRLIAQYVVVVIVQTGEEGSPGGAAHRVADEGLLEGGALIGQQGDYLGHLLSRNEVQVVGEDEDDVGPTGGRLRPFFLGRSGCRGLRSRAARYEEEKDQQTCQDSEGRPSPCPERRHVAAAWRHETPTLL